VCGACGAVGVGVGRCQCAHACVHVAVLAVLPVCTHAGAAAGAQQQRPGAQQLRPEGTSSHRPAASACSAHVIRPACSNGPARYPRGLPTEPPHGLQSQPDLCGCASFAYTNVVALCPLPLSLFPFLACYRSRACLCVAFVQEGYLQQGYAFAPRHLEPYYDLPPRRQVEEAGPGRSGPSGLPAKTLEFSPTRPKVQR